MTPTLRTVSAALALLALPVITTGCVPQDRYDHLVMAKRTVEEQLVRAEDERDSYQTALEQCQSDRGRFQSANVSLQDQLGGLQGSVSDLEQQNMNMLGRISQLQVGPLPQDMERALTDLAAQYPDLLSFDARRGMLRLASDFTFDLGSAQLRSGATDTVRRLATILNDGKARDFEIQIVGHTDNVPIRKPETRRNHPSNTHLSVHRAISVGDSLKAAGIDPTRVQVAGYGPYRPAVQNGARGEAANRRVEIFLTPMPMLDAYPGAVTEYVPEQPAVESVSVPDDEPMK